jgi:hypothetical protein
MEAMLTCMQSHIIFDVRHLGTFFINGCGENIFLMKVSYVNNKEEKVKQV